MEQLKDEILVAIESMKTSMDTWKSQRDECAQRLKELEEASLMDETTPDVAADDIQQAYNKIDETFATLIIGIINTLGNAIHFLGQVNTESIDILSIQTHFQMIKQIFFDHLNHAVNDFGRLTIKGFRIVPPPITSSLTEDSERDWKAVIKSLSEHTWKYRKNLSLLRNKTKFMNNTNARKALIPLTDTKHMMCIVRDIHRDIANASPEWKKWMDEYITATMDIIVANTDPSLRCDMSEKDLRNVVKKNRS